jgi:RHS repeat-associated protein
VKSLKIARQLVLFVAFCVCLAPAAHAQLGFPPFGSFQPGGFDSVNLQNLNVNFSIPIMSSSGRGIGLSYSMSNNSLIWNNYFGAWYTTSLDATGNPVIGWTVSGITGAVTNSAFATFSCGSPLLYTGFAYTDTNGTIHHFAIDYYGANSCSEPTSASGYATDGSGIYITSSGGTSTVTLPAGGTVSGGTQVDRNGNYISQVIVSSSETDWIDSVGRTALKVTKGSPNTTIQWLNPSGTYETTTIQYASFNIQTNFAVAGVVEYSGTTNLPTEIDLPNGNKYLFTYETTPGLSGYTTGRISQVTLPAGGYYQYLYGGANDGVDATTGATNSLTRIISDGTNVSQWKYSRALVSSNWVTTVTAPQMPYDSAPNQSVFTFNSSGQETQEKYYKGSASGTPLRTVDTTWATNGTPATKITTLDTSQQSEVATTYDDFGNLTLVYEYDWGSGAVGSFIRSTALQYTSAAPFLLTQKYVYDASFVMKYREDRAYDGAALTTVTGANHHDDTNYGSSYTSRGNLTSLTTYSDAATPSGADTKNFTYDTLGNTLTAQVNCCQQKQFNYSSTTQWSAPDSVVSGPSGGPQLTKSATYNAYTGQVATTTDENGQVTSYGYDAYRRPTSVTRPDGTVLSTSYNDTSFVITTTTPIDGSHSAKSLVAYDGLGRPITGTTEDASSAVYAITSTEYDPMGRAYKSSNPYTSSPSYWTTSEFDGAGRQIATILPDGSQSTASYSGNAVIATDPSGKQRRSYFDAPGRLVQVDEPTATATLAAGSGSGTVSSGPDGFHAAAGATAGVGTVTITGSEGIVSVDNPTFDCVLWDGDECDRWQWDDNWTNTYDTGTVSITVNGHTDSTSYGSGSGPSNVANSLKSIINSDSSASVTATSIGAVITLTAKTTGSATNYALLTASATTDTSGNFFSPSFYGAESGDVLTGGGPATSNTYDSGNISVTIDGNDVSVSYGSSSTSSSIASALATAINSATSMPVTAFASGAGITLTATTAGAATNYSISSASTTSQPTLFSAPSFLVAMSGATLTGGAGPDALSSSVSTTYTYNPLNRLTGVTQGSQTRSYSYDDLGRLTSATTPEAGTVTTTYNGFNLVTSVTDARGVVSNYSYDSLNRVTGLSYSVSGTGVTGTSAVSYTYGTSSGSYNNGRLISMSDGTGSETYTYDMLGRTTELDKVIGSTTYSTEYGYNLAGEISQITYPSGRVVTQTYDAIGRLCGVGASGSTCSSGTRYASGYNYNTAGELTGLTYGNGVVTNLSYTSDRLQLHCLQYDTTSLSDPCTKDSSALFMLTYAYGPSGTNSGQISSIIDGMDSGRTASYTYDGLGRLSTAGTLGSTAYPAWGLSWTYDRYGNRTAQNNTAGSVPNDTLTISTSTNRVTGTGYSYDAAGNMTGDFVNTMTYDAASRLIASSNSSASGAYAYDGKGLRVKKCVPTCSSPTTTTVYIFAGGKVLAEYDNGAAVGSPSRENIYSGGTQIAKLAGGTTTYYHQDHLSNRLVTSSTGTVVEQMGHLPYGENWYDTGSAKWRFTSYERDAESGNDYALARYDASRLGRFTSPDPLSGTITNPQSLNHYAYVGNDPINAVDPSGADMITICGAGPAMNFLDQTCAGENYARYGGLMTGSWGGGAGINYGTDAQVRQFDPDESDPANLSGCSLTINVQNDDDLSEQELSAAEGRVAALFGTAGVGINWVTSGSGSAPFTVNFGDAGYEGSIDWGNTAAYVGATANVWADNVQYDVGRFGLGQSALNNALGNTGAHELVHAITGLPDVQWTPQSNPRDLMSQGTNPNELNNMTKNNVALTSGEKEALLGECQKLQKAGGN